MSLSAAAQVLDGRLQGASREFTAVSTDTRTLEPGALYFALRGPRFDGHDWLAAAREAGAAGAVVERDLATPLATIRVDDTRAALGRLAAHWRSNFDLPLVGITGSNGKTTVKEMAGLMLEGTGPGVVTRGNLNNDIGVPLTLLRLRAGDRFAVIEMGMNHAGEIDYLTRLARPDVALITNAAAAHLAGLGDVARVARAKGEIFAGLAPNGTACINADDDFAPMWHTLAAPRRILTFGLRRSADVSAEYSLDTSGADVEVRSPAGALAMRLSLLGAHNVMNAVAAVAAVIAAGFDAASLAPRLATLVPARGRLCPMQAAGGARLIDDTYNANPASLDAALAVLAAFDGERVLVLGDMGELGPAAAELHRRAGAHARAAGVTRVYALGELSRAAVEGFGRGASHFDDRSALADSLRARMHPGMVVLVKGSRASAMDRVVALLTEDRD